MALTAHVGLHAQNASEEEPLPRHRKQLTRGHCTNMSQQHEPQADPDCDHISLLL